MLFFYGAPDDSIMDKPGVDTTIDLWILDYKYNIFYDGFYNLC